MITERKQSLNSIHLDDYEDTFDEDSDVLLEKFSYDEADAGFLKSDMVPATEGGKKKIKYLADEELNDYGTDDVDAFLQGVNQKLVQEHEAAIEAARWKPESSRRKISDIEVTDLDIEDEGAASEKTSSKDKSTGKKSIIGAFGSFIGATAGNMSKSSSTSSSSSRKSSSTGARTSSSKSSSSNRTRTGSTRTSGTSATRTASSATRKSTGASQVTRKPGTSVATSKTESKANTYDRRSSRHTASQQQREEPVRSRSSRDEEVQTRTSAGLIVAKYVVLLILFIIVVIVCIKGYNLGYDLFNDLPVDATNLVKVEFTTTGDETDEEMGQKLYEAGLIDDVQMYVYRCMLYKPDYRSGTFKLSKAYNTEKITNILSGYNYSDGTIEEEEEETEAAEEAVEGEEAVAAEGGEEAVAEEGVEEGGGEWYDEVVEEY